MKNNIVSFSGGKDSTAMLLMMLERGEDIHSVVFFDTGWEFPQMHDHIARVEEYAGIEIVKLKPEKSFDYWVLDRPVVGRKGKNKGIQYRRGNGWPSPMRRWCTREKVRSMNLYLDSVKNPVSCVGYGSDEAHRVKVNSKYPCRYPLLEYDKTEQDCLDYCLERGFDWGGLYGIYRRVSCYCCPLQRISDLKKLRKNFPELWSKTLYTDKMIQDNIGFHGYNTVQDLEKRFAEEDRHLKLPGIN